MNEKRIREWLNDGIEPNSCNIYSILLNQLKPEDIDNENNTRQFLILLKEMEKASKKWDKEIDKVLN